MGADADFDPTGGRVGIQVFAGPRVAKTTPMRGILLLAAALSACSFGPSGVTDDSRDGDTGDQAPGAGNDDGGETTDGAAAGPCVDVTDQAPVVIATAGSADEFALTLEAASFSHTAW